MGFELLIGKHVRRDDVGVILQLDGRCDEPLVRRLSAVVGVQDVLL